MMSTDFIAQSYRQFKPEASEDEVLKFIGQQKKLRETHPYISGSDEHWKSTRHAEHMVASSGESHLIARLTAGLCDASLVTDIPFRWKQIEIERRSNHADVGPWEPISKALNGVKLEVLDSVSLPAALARIIHESLNDESPLVG